MIFLIIVSSVFLGFYIKNQLKDNLIDSYIDKLISITKSKQIPTFVSKKTGYAKNIDVKNVIQTHLHLDHSGAIGHFPNATHITQRIEYDYAFNPDWFSQPAYVRADFDKPNIRWKFLQGKKTDYFDLYGDGVIKIEMHFLSPVSVEGKTSKEVKQEVFDLMWNYYAKHQQLLEGRI